MPLAICLFLLGCMWSLPVSALQPTDAKPTTANTWSDSHKGFTARLYLSDKPRDFAAQWFAPSPAIQLSPGAQVARGVPVVGFVIFGGCQADGEKLCNASVDFTVLKPDGGIYAHYTDRDLWKGKAAPATGEQQLGATYIGVVIEPGDPLGTYLFKAIVRDDNAGISLRLQQGFIAIDDGAPRRHR